MKCVKHYLAMLKSELIRIKILNFLNLLAAIKVF